MRISEFKLKCENCGWKTDDENFIYLNDCMFLREELFSKRVVEGL